MPTAVSSPPPSRVYHCLSGRASIWLLPTLAAVSSKIRSRTHDLQIRTPASESFTCLRGSPAVCFDCINRTVQQLAHNTYIDLRECARAVIF